MSRPPVLYSPSRRHLVTPTFEAIVGVTGPLPHDFGDWPAKMQDTVYRAAAAIKPHCPVGYNREIVATKCDRDPDGWFVKIVVMDRPRLAQ